MIGGQEAADEFVRKVREHIASFGSIQEVDNVQIVVRAYANLAKVAQACMADGRLDNISDLSQFWVGFSRRYPQVDFVNIGSGKEEADNKIRGN